VFESLKLCAVIGVQLLIPFDFIFLRTLNVNI
jgi:hypothetical protein